MKKELIELGLDLLSRQHFDSLAVGVIDFKNSSFDSFEISATNVVSERPYLYFDLASLTKALTNSAVKLKQPELFDEKSNLLLNHIAGLPSGGLLSKKGWREFLLEYDIKLSPNLYSDYSSLRCMLEIEKKSGKKLKDLCSYYFDPEMTHWTTIPVNAFSPEYGIRNKHVISGEVHDNNCYNIGEFISHAGLFATVGGLCRSLINLNKQASMIDQLNIGFKTHKNEDRFIMGFDHVMDPENTLAGKGATIKTFGHLGFTGTSFWIDPEQQKGAVILTNATQTYWYERSGLTTLRKTLGAAIWRL
ncbi:MAG: beta-lactamase family protein [Rhizobacter sp.]|nr:beta-lactamase family protein [Bacteriovorax sp.]